MYVLHKNNNIQSNNVANYTCLLFQKLPVQCFMFSVSELWNKGDPHNLRETFSLIWLSKLGLVSIECQLVHLLITWVSHSQFSESVVVLGMGRGGHELEATDQYIVFTCTLDVSQPWLFVWTGIVDDHTSSSLEDFITFSYTLLPRAQCVSIDVSVPLGLHVCFVEGCFPWSRTSYKQNNLLSSRADSCICWL